jgi:sulfate/thiosulfate transport system substrate-binding protein
VTIHSDIRSLRSGPPNRWLNVAALLALVVAAALVAVKNVGAQDAGGGIFLNVSYDPTRELYRELNERFALVYRSGGGKILPIQQSHGGSSRQAAAVADGLAADVVTLAMYSDVDALRKRGLIAPGWSARLPNDSLPYISTIVFVVRKGNPWRIHDWPDLVRSGVSIVTPNPRTSGNGRLSFLAAWGAVLRRGGDDDAARVYVSQLYEHVASLEDGARAATATFAEEKVGDVHITWENEALLEVEESKGDLQVVYPPVSIRAEPYVAWVDENVKRKGTLSQAKAYLAFLYSDEAQDIIAQKGYRPTSPKIQARYRERFPPIDLFAITLVARDWTDAQERFFSDNGLFDAIQKTRPK